MTIKSSKNKPAPTGKAPSVKTLAHKVSAITVTTANLKIVNREGYKVAATKLKALKGWQQLLKELRIRVVRALNEAKEKQIREFESALEKAATGERNLKDAMLDFDKRESAIIEKEQAKLDRQTNTKRDKIQARAQVARSAGKHEKAEELERLAREVISPTLAAATPHVKGIATRSTWDYVIEDESKLPDAWKIPNHPKIRQAVNALGDHANIPGVKVTEHRDIAAKAE